MISAGSCGHVIEDRGRIKRSLTPSRFTSKDWLRTLSNRVGHLLMENLTEIQPGHRAHLRCLVQWIADFPIRRFLREQGDELIGNLWHDNHALGGNAGLPAVLKP